MNPRLFGLTLVPILLCMAPGTPAQNQEEERKLICRYERRSPYILGVMRQCNDCGLGVCVGRAECRYPDTSFVSVSVECLSWGSKCPDASACANEAELLIKDPEGIIQVTEGASEEQDGSTSSR